jgi:hypothetical protein
MEFFEPMAHRIPVIFNPQRTGLGSDLPSNCLGGLARLVLGASVFLSGISWIFNVLLARPVFSLRWKTINQLAFLHCGQFDSFWNHFLGIFPQESESFLWRGE